MIFSFSFTDDFSRVRLVSMNEEEGSDYINANYIPVSKNSVLKKKHNSCWWLSHNLSIFFSFQYFAGREVFFPPATKKLKEKKKKVGGDIRLFTIFTIFSHTNTE